MSGERVARTISNVMASTTLNPALRFGLAAAIASRELRPKKRFPKARRKRDRGYALREMEAMNDREFQEMFRVTRGRFDSILRKIEGDLRKDEQKAKNSAGSPITATTKLAVTLRFLAGGSHHDIRFAFGISKGSFYSATGAIWPTIEAIDKHYPLEFPMNDNQKLAEVGDAFGAFSPHGIMQNCVGAIDGLLIRTRCPYKSEHSDGASFRNRKKCFGILALGVADVQGRFLSFAVKWTGSTHDSTALQTSALGQWVEEGNLPHNFFFIGDDAFSCTDQILCPWPGRGLGPWKDAFNYHLSHSRQCIERGFGMYTRRWGILWRKLTFDFERWPLVAVVCAKLHNMCCDDNFPPPPRFHDDLFGKHKTPADEAVVLNDDEGNVDGLNHVQRARGTRRLDLTDELENRGIKRPKFAQCRSREN
jgi:hypothetical protein